MSTRVRRFLAGAPWSLGAYFVASFLYFALVFDPTLYAYHHQPVFFFHRGFFADFLRYPGGVVEAGAQFFFQFLRFRIAGAMLLAGGVVTMLALLQRLLGRLWGEGAQPLAAALPVLLLLAQQRPYSFPLIIGVKYVCVVVAFLLYVRLHGRGRYLGLLLSVLLYYALGGWWLLFYSVLAGLYQLLYATERGRFLHTILGVLTYAVLPLLATGMLFLISLKEAYLYLVPYEFYQAPYTFHADARLLAFFAMLPLLLVGRAVVARIGGWVWAPRWAEGRRWGGVGRTVGLLLLGAGALWWGYDAEQRKAVEIDYLASQGRWMELLEVSRRVRKEDPRIIFHTNRALYHTGGLLERMFAYRQPFAAQGLFLTRIGTVGQIAMPSSDLYLELGHVKAAQVMAYEGQTRRKYDPRILRRLALTNVIDENEDAAEMFLGLLERSLLERAWAQQLRMRATGTGEAGAFIRSLRAGMPHADFFINGLDPDRDLVKILAEHPENRMAREYLLGYYLLECRVGDLLRALKRWSPEAERIPRHVEEALLLIRATRPEALRGTSFAIRTRTVNRFLQFNGILERYPAAAAEKMLLERGLGDTYWYYGRYLKPRQAQRRVKTRKIDVDVY